MNRIFLILLCTFFFSCTNSNKQRDFNYDLEDKELINSDLESLEENITSPNSEFSNHNVVEMQEENGVRYIWVEVNGINLRFIFDTGASSISISSAEATVLFKQGTLTEQDILDVEYFQDATGNISAGTIINLQEVKIGNISLENVRASVVDNVNAPLLLGQSVLERFGSIEIDNYNNVIIFK